MNVIETKKVLVINDSKIVKKLKILAKKSPLKLSRIFLHKSIKNNTNE